MRKKIFTGSVSNLLNMLLSILCGVVQIALAARFLPLPEMGIWMVLLSLSLLLTFCDFGLGPTLSREVGFAMKKQYAQRRIRILLVHAKYLIHRLVWILFFIGLIGGGLYFYAIVATSSLRWQAEITLIIFVGGAALLLLANPYLGTLFGMGEVSLERSLRSVGIIFWICCAWLFLWLDFGLIGLACSLLLRAALVYCCARFLVQKRICVGTNRIYATALKRLLPQSIKWSLMAFGAYFTLQAGVFFIGAYLGPSAVPQYTVLMQIASAVMLVAGVFSGAIIPFISRSKAQEDVHTIKKLTLLSLKISVSLAIVLCTFFLFFIHPVLVLWVGPHIVINLPTLYILLIVTLLEVQHVSVSTIAMAAGYVEFAIPSLLACAINIILAIIFVKQLGIVGAALSILVAQLSTNNWYAIYASFRFLKIPGRFFYHYLAKELVFLILMICAGYINCHILMLYSLNNWFVCIIGAFVLSICGLFLFFYILLNSEERIYLQTILLTYLLKKGKTHVT